MWRLLLIAVLMLPLALSGCPEDNKAANTTKKSNSARTNEEVYGTLD